jgi:hypothetical protein
LWASDTRFDSKTHLLQLRPDSQTEAALAGVDQHRNGRAGAEELRYLGESSLNGLKRILACDQADCVLPLWNAACRGGGYPKETPPSQRQIELQAAVARNDGAMQAGQARELDHGIDDLFPV